MNKKITIAALLILFIFMSVQLKAQNNKISNLPSTWSLQQCIDYASQHNIQINSLRLTKASAEQDLLQAKAAKQPNLSGSASQLLTAGNVANQSTGGLQYRLNNSGSYSLNSSVVLFNDNYLNNDIKQKNLSQQAADFDITTAENDISIQITQYYLSILLVKENVTYLQEVIKTSQAQLNQGQIKFNAGSIAKKDLVQLDAQLATDQYNLVTAQNQLRQNTLLLKQLLQLPSGYDINIEQPQTIYSDSLVSPLADAQNIALVQRPEIKSSQLAVQIAGTDLLKAKAGLKPILSANGALATSFASLNQPKYPTQLGDYFNQHIGLTLSVPIFNNRQVKTNIEKSKIAIEQSKLNLFNTQTVLSQQVEQAYINLLNAQSQYQAAKVQFTANTENYRIANEELRLGAVSTVDYLLQKNLYVQAMQAYIQSRYNVAITAKIYDFYKGEPLKL